jgi:hypothetical protein
MVGDITSRLIGSGSEALLMIDEPGAVGLSGVGPAESQSLCPTPLTGCQAWVGTVTNGGGSGVDITNGPTGAANVTPAPNVYQGVVTNANQVTFFGVPILAPVSSGVARVLRITNLRLNAAGYQVGNGFVSVLAQISVNNVQVSVNNPTVTVGYIQQSFAGSFRDATNSTSVATDNEYQCQPKTDKLVAVLRFRELFGTAFKTRVNGGNGGSGFGLYPATVNQAAIQNIPGAIYNSESGFISAFSGSATPGVLTSSAGFTAGLADYGTRLKAEFSNIPPGVSVYVSAVNLTDGTTPIGGLPAGTGIIPASTGNGVLSNSPELAFLVNSEAGIDSPLPLQTGLTGGQWLLPVSATGTSQAVWEVVQTLPNTQENYDFGVYITFANNILPTQGISATLSYAPTPSVFTLPAGAEASSTLTIPRFVSAPPSNGTPFLNINLCTTALLFPYITTAFLVPGQSGFDTGISIANTTSDPFGTTTQAARGNGADVKSDTCRRVCTTSGVTPPAGGVRTGRKGLTQ